jgi:hypothetical protein
MMFTLYSIAELPRIPAVYAMYGGTGKSLHAAYVGQGGNLKDRIEQHLIRRDSSVTTNTSPVSLNPDLIIEVRWWAHASFSDKERRRAAELVAFDVIQPVLRSRGTHSAASRELYADKNFYTEMEAFFRAKEQGRLIVPNLAARVAEIEKRLSLIEKRLED